MTAGAYPENPFRTYPRVFILIPASRRDIGFLGGNAWALRAVGLDPAHQLSQYAHMSTCSTSEALELLLKGTITCHTVASLRARLEEGRALRVKAGFDPTAPDLHLGHAVLLRKMAQFQKLGHTVIFLIGDFTGMIGDPTGKKATRPPLTRGQINENAETYKAQVFRILDPDRTEIRFNSEWLDPLHGPDWIRLASKFTLAQLLERNDFQKRLGAKEPISFHELLYPLVQAYDSVALQADVELGGSDQLFNLMRGRDLQDGMGQPPQIVVTVPLLLGLDGVEKMSKSLGNYIGFFEDADAQFGKTMSIRDDLMWDWYLLLTDRLPSEIEGLKQGHPMDAKKTLAQEIVTQFHGWQEAKEAEARWVRRFSDRQVEEVPCMVVPPSGRDVPFARLLTDRGLAGSRKEAERLLRQGAVSLDGVKVSDPSLRMDLQAGETVLVRVGKLRLQRWVIQ